MIKKRKSSPTEVDAYVGYRIKIRRTELSLTQEDLAKAIGVSFQQIQKYESGTNRIAPSRILDISKKLKVPISYFFMGVDELPRETLFLQETVSHPQKKGKKDPHTLEQQRLFELVEVFQKIKSQTLKEQILALAKAIAQEESRS